MTTTEEQVRRKARVLAAFMPQADAIGFATSFPLDPQGFINEWQARAAVVAAMPPGYTAPRIEDPLADAHAHIAGVMAHQAFGMIYKSVEFKFIELGRLIAYQFWMDTDVSHGVHGAGSSQQPSSDELLQKCLPLDLVPPTAMRWEKQERPGDRVTVSAYSLNNTLSFNHAGHNHQT